MRKTLLMSAALFGVAVAAPAFAQTTSPMQSTQTPPSSQSGQQAPQPANSMPAGAAGQGGTRLNQTGGSQTYQGNVSTGAPTNTGATPSQYRDARRAIHDLRLDRNFGERHGQHPA